MTISVDLGRKATKQTNQPKHMFRLMDNKFIAILCSIEFDTPNSSSSDAKEKH